MKSQRNIKAAVFAAILAVVSFISCGKQEDPTPEIILTLSTSSVSLTKGESVVVSATVEPSEFASELSWVMSDESVAMVSEGKVTGLNPGKTTLWAFVRDEKASCTVTVLAVEPQEVVLSRTSLDMKPSETFQLEASLAPEGAEGSIMWKSSDPSVVTVDETGLVTAAGYGKAIVSARCGLLVGECIVSVLPDAPKIGDYFYSDGTWSDGGLLSIGEDGTSAQWASSRPAPLEGKTVIGMVFQTNQDRISNDDKVNGYTHGYVVSTHIAQYPGEPETKYSLDEGIDCLNNCKVGSSWYANLKGSWETDVVYGTYKAGMGTEYIPAFKLVKEDFEAAPESTSGWFLPSTGQLWDLVANFCGDEVAEMLKGFRTLSYDITYERGIKASYSVIDKFNEMAAMVPDSMKDDLYVPESEAYHNYCGIWTSTLYDNSDGAACIFYLGNGNGYTFPCTDWVDNPYFIKPILAF